MAWIFVSCPSLYIETLNLKVIVCGGGTCKRYLGLDEVKKNPLFFGWDYVHIKNKKKWQINKVFPSALPSSPLSSLLLLLSLSLSARSKQSQWEDTTKKKVLIKLALWAQISSL